MIPLFSSCHYNIYTVFSQILKLKNTGGHFRGKGHGKQMPSWSILLGCQILLSCTTPCTPDTSLGDTTQADFRIFWDVSVNATLPTSPLSSEQNPAAKLALKDVYSALQLCNISMANLIAHIHGMRADILFEVTFTKSKLCKSFFQNRRS